MYSYRLILRKLNRPKSVIIFIDLLLPVTQTSNMDLANKTILSITLGLTLVLNSSCISRPGASSNRYKDSENQPLVEDKYRLTKDREYLEQMRKDIPDARQTENDEIAYIIGLTSQTNIEPSKVRDQFSSALRKKRELFDKDMRKEREEYTKNERKTREKFLADQKRTRDEFLKEKPRKEERDDFFNQQSTSRKEFFENERERRSDYEADVRERRKNFEDYARQKNNEFNQEYRQMSRRWEDQKKAKKQVRSYSTNSNDEAAQLEYEIEEAKRRGLLSPIYSGE